VVLDSAGTRVYESLGSVICGQGRQRLARNHMRRNSRVDEVLEVVCLVLRVVKSQTGGERN